MNKTGLDKILMAAGLVIVLAFAWLKPLEMAAESQIDAGFKRALASYAIARTLNAVISVAQGTQLSIEPGGVGVNLAPGQILEPVNNLVKQFSDLMLAALVAFGVMKISLDIGSYWLISLTLSGVASGWVWMRWHGRNPTPLLSKILYMLLVLRFAVPVMTVGSDFVFRQFLAGHYAESQNAIEAGSGQLETLNIQDDAAGSKMAPVAEGVSSTIQVPAPATVAEINDDANPGFMNRTWNIMASMKAKAGEKLGQIGQTIKQNMDVHSRIEKIKNLATSLVQHIVNVIVVFILQTLVMPLIFIWLFYRFLKQVFLGNMQT